MAEVFAALGLIILLALQVLAGMLTILAIVMLGVAFGCAVRDLLDHKKGDHDC